MNLPPGPNAETLPNAETGPSRESTTHAFLMRAAELLHRYGTPSHRLERVMTKVAHILGVPSVFLYTPTALVVSLGAGRNEKTYMRRVDSGSVDVDKLIRFDETLEQLTAGLITIDQADERMTAIASAKPPYGFLLTTIACGLACGSVAVFLGGGFRELQWAAIFGFLIAILEAAHERLRWERGLLEPVAGFFAALGSLAVAKYLYPLDDRLVTLAALVVLLPGLSLTIALTELAVGHLSAGVARLAGALAILLTLVLGVGLAWRVGANWRLLPETVSRLPSWADGLALLLAPLAFAILFRAGWRQWPIIFAVSWAGFLTTRFSGRAWGPKSVLFWARLSSVAAVTCMHVIAIDPRSFP